MILRRVYIPFQSNLQHTIVLDNDKIYNLIPEHSSDQSAIEFPTDVIAFPGLINAHEHLGLNTHPIHKSRQYTDYIDWALDDFKPTIEEINSIPFKLRYEWGILKNVLHGFTTIFQHDAYLKDYKSDIADVYTDTLTIHSLKFDKKWKLKALLPFNKKKKIIHLCEGTNMDMRDEGKRFLRWSTNSKHTIIVHGINLTSAHAEQFGGLVWCPNSNIHLYGATANINTLKHKTPILFGTDSTVSAHWDLWHHIKQAKALKLLSDKELYTSITQTPTEIFNLEGKGQFKIGNIADLVIAKKKHSGYLESFYSLEAKDILLVIKSGKIVLFDSSLDAVVSKFTQDCIFEKIEIQGSIKSVSFKISELTKAIKKYYPNFSTEPHFKVF